MNTSIHEPWNKGKLVKQKAPLRLRDIWAIRIRLQLRANTRDLALFNLAIDSKPRACDLVKLRVRDIAHGTCVARRSIVAATENPPSGAVRDHGANADRDIRLAHSRTVASGLLPISE